MPASLPPRLASGLVALLVAGCQGHAAPTTRDLERLPPRVAQLALEDFEGCAQLDAVQWSKGAVTITGCGERHTYVDDLTGVPVKLQRRISHDFASCDQLDVDEVDGDYFEVGGCGQRIGYTRLCRTKVNALGGVSQSCQWVKESSHKEVATAAGDRGQNCYPNLTCNAGLECMRGVCIPTAEEFKRGPGEGTRSSERTAERDDDDDDVAGTDL